jgi:hypothetical protein
METFEDLLDAAERRGGHKPFVTFVDLDTGERTELSFVVAANWARKIGNFVIAELEAGPGIVVIWPPAEHWTTPLIALGVWAAGAGIEAGEPHAAWPGEPGTPEFNQVLAEPDQLDAPPADRLAPALVLDEMALDHAWLLGEAARDEDGGERVLLRREPLSRAWSSGLLRALGQGGSVVLVRGGDEDAVARVAEQERVTRFQIPKA